MKNFLLFFLSLHVYAVDEELLNAIDQNYAFKEQIVFSNNIEQFSSGYLIRSENEVQIQINEPFKESYTYKDGYIKYIDYDLPSESFFDVKDLNNPIIDLFLMKVQKKDLNIIKNRNSLKKATEYVFKELNQCYGDGTWYDEVGTSKDKRNISHSLN